MNTLNAGPELDDDDFDTEYEDGDDYYDGDGRSTPGGMFDVGGHLISERYADYADTIRDRIRDEGF
jgi:hypothetical protein